VGQAPLSAAIGLHQVQLPVAVAIRLEGDAALFSQRAAAGQKQEQNRERE
jgi:hypothetical protein